MSIFSDLLATHIKNKEIRTFSLAQYCEMDRSNMYKLINGKRNPSSELMVQRMSEFMRLTNSEHKEFVEAYHISLIGSDVYYRRRNVQKFLEFFKEQKNFSPSSGLFLPEYEPLEEKNPIYITEKSDLKNAIHMIISLAGKSDGHVQMILQPRNSEVIEILRNTRGGYRIEHIFCLNNSKKVDEKTNYNLNVLRNIIPFFYQDYKYEPYFYYDDISAYENIFHLFHSMIVTTDYVLVFSENIKQGVLFSQKDMVANFSNLFESLKKESKSMVGQILNLEDQMNYFNSGDFEKIKGYEFQQQPCFVPLMPVEFADKYLIQELPNREMFVEMTVEYIRMLMEQLKSGMWTIMFTKDGIENFIETGNIDELPKGTYHEIEMADKKLLIRNLILVCSSLNYRMMRQDAPIAKCRINLYTNARKGCMMFKNVKNQMIWLTLDENGILHAFNDYLASLEESNFYTVEETVEILKDILDRY